VPWFFDHAETASAESLDRIATLGGAVSVQNRMMFQGRAFVERYGVERAQNAPPIKAMLERGLLVAAGTDATRVSSYNPWLSLSWLVSGRTVGGLLLNGPQDRVDRGKALEMYTAAGASLTGEAGKKGQIKTGQYADLAILSADFFSVPEAEISFIESVLTIAGGRIVYSSGPFEGAAVALPDISPSWSPVARFGGFQARSGLAQARDIVEAVLDSELQRRWRERSGDPVADGAHSSAGFDPLGGCGDL
jgi:hypothetical protein